MKYSDWTDQEWERLLKMVRRDGVRLKEKEIREAAWSYMHAGADGGGNRFGLEGTIVALCVDAI